jgi:hypothetical protein
MIKPTFPKVPDHYNKPNLTAPDFSILDKIDTLKIFGEYYKVKKINYYQEPETNNKLLKLNYNHFNKIDENCKINTNSHSNIIDNEEVIKKNVEKIDIMKELKDKIKSLKNLIVKFYEVLGEKATTCDNTLLEIRYVADTLRILIYELKKKNTLITAKVFFENEIINQTISYQSEITDGLDSTKNLMKEILDLSTDN